jgi:hypothetical protein
VIAFVKHEGDNLGTMATTLQSIINCEPLKLLWVYKGICFGHVMFKTCQYATNDDKVSVGLTLVNVKDAQTCLQKIITWTNNLGKGGKNGKMPELRVGCGTKTCGRWL